MTVAFGGGEPSAGIAAPFGQVGENSPSVDLRVLPGNPLEGCQADICLVRGEGEPAVRFFTGTGRQQNCFTLGVYCGVWDVKATGRLGIGECFVE